MSTTAMKTLYMSYVIVLVCQFAQPITAWGSNNRGLNRNSFSDEQKLLQIIRDVKRTSWLQALCGKWDDWCVSDSDRAGLTCCDGYICKCNLWNTNCRCKSRLFSSGK